MTHTDSELDRVMGLLRSQHAELRTAASPAMKRFIHREIQARSMVSFGGATRAARLEAALEREARAILTGQVLDTDDVLV